jgi:hypothetical protein
MDQRIFHIVLRVLILQAEKLQHQRIFDLFFGHDEVIGLRLRALAKHGRLVLRQQRPLVRLAIDLPIHLPYGPSAAQCFFLARRANSSKSTIEAHTSP